MQHTVMVLLWRKHEDEGAQVPRAGRQRGTCTPRGGRSRRGRFSAEAIQFLRGLVSAKVRDVPDILKWKAAAAWSRRWRSMLGCVVANFFALSFLGRVPLGADGEVPLLSDVPGADRHQ